MNRIEHYHTAHAYIKQRRRKELLSTGLIALVACILLFSSSAFIYQTQNGPLLSNLKDTIFTPAQESVVELQELIHEEPIQEDSIQEEIVSTIDKSTPQVTEKEEDTSIPVSQEENHEDEEENNNSSNSPPTPSVEKPVITLQIAKLIQATSPTKIDISQHYTVIG